MLRAFLASQPATFEPELPLAEASAACRPPPRSIGGRWPQKASAAVSAVHACDFDRFVLAGVVLARGLGDLFGSLARRTEDIEEISEAIRAALAGDRQWAPPFVSIASFVLQ